jgi:hypothetical protein
MIRHPVAGNMFAFFQYVMGFHRMGHDVYYLEESGWSNSCYDPVQMRYGDDPSYGIAALKALMVLYDVSVPVFYIHRDTGTTVGIEHSELEQLLSRTELLINVGGVCALTEFSLVARRALIDMDPMFTQLGRYAVEDLGNYDVYFSYGTNIGQADCKVPSGGLNWRPTVPPVVPEIWQEYSVGDDRRLPSAPFTTICNWNAYGSVMYEGEPYGQKDEEFMHQLELPNFITEKLELAVSGASEEVVAQFRKAGWSIRQATELNTDPFVYMDYIGLSKGEFSVAKNAYVKSRSGWISDRSVCYLAAGRPVVIQDTGIGEWLPTGHGMSLFSTVEEAAAAIAEISVEYVTQRRAARELVDEYFSASIVLPRILETAMGSEHG